MPGASAELLTRAQNGAEARSMWPQQEVLGRVHLDVSKNRGTPKWMVKIMENPYEQMDDLGVPFFLETPILCILLVFQCFSRGVQ